MSSQPNTTSTAIWYFVAATFIFAGSTTVFTSGGSPWLGVLGIVAGAVILAAGVVVFRREGRQRRDPRSGQGHIPPTS